MKVFPQNNIGKIITGHICVVIRACIPFTDKGKDIRTIKTFPVYGNG
jgi:hypothetical protein